MKIDMKSLKKNKKTLIFIFLLSIFFVFLLKILHQNVFYVSIENIYELKKEISEEDFYVSELKKQILYLNKKIKNYSGASKHSKNEINEIQSEIDKYKILSGACSVYGEGVVIIIDDGYRNYDTNYDLLNLIVHDLDIKKITTELYNAGAEAISINDNRIIMGLSEILCNGPTIRINGVQQSRPFIIRAIGDKYKLSQILLSYDSYGSVLIKSGVNFELITKSDIKIDAYNKFDKYNYGFVLEE